MSAQSKIEWTHHTMNPWWGCAKVSPACDACYAERDSKRYGYDVWGPHAERRFFGEKHWNDPLRWNRAAEKAGERRRVFCASMADVFEVRNDEIGKRLDDERVKLWKLIEATPWLDWLLLTKRPENILRCVPLEWRPRTGLTPRNVWLGVTAEDQHHANKRIPLLLKAKQLLGAPIAFVSHEPAIEAVDFTTWLNIRSDVLPRLDWLITGGESGTSVRSYDVAWARSVIAQCRAAGAAVFVKQLGAKAHRVDWGVNPIGSTPLVPLTLKQRKGNDPAEWPEDIRVREFPVVPAERHA